MSCSRPRPRRRPRRRRRRGRGPPDSATAAASPSEAARRQRRARCAARGLKGGCAARPAGGRDAVGGGNEFDAVDHGSRPPSPPRAASTRDHLEEPVVGQQPAMLARSAEPVQPLQLLKSPIMCMMAQHWSSGAASVTPSPSRSIARAAPRHRPRIKAGGPQRRAFGCLALPQPTANSFAHVHSITIRWPCQGT